MSSDDDCRGRFQRRKTGSADQLSRNTIYVAAGEACVRFGPRSDAAVVKSDDAVFQDDRKLRFYDCYAAERRLRQLLRSVSFLN